jgi:serine-type D-Ala-D-Ala carboxypeptidase/endopeptidase (penicillin-binding protein 4)
MAALVSRDDRFKFCTMTMPTMILIALTLAIAGPAAAQDAAPLSVRIATQLKSGSPGTRFGVVVTDDTGREIVSIDPEGRYIPASNTKIFTTAAAFATLANLDASDPMGGTAVLLVPGDKRRLDVIVQGMGDARLSSAADCTVDCLATLADAVAAKTRKVGNIVGDDTLYPDERWSPGMSWNNIPTDSGTGISALSLDDNEVALTVTPTALGGAPTTVVAPYFTVDNRAMTLASGGVTALNTDRAPNGTVIVLTGTIAADAKPQKLTLGIDDPADYAAWRFKALLETRGVRVLGTVSARHRPLLPDPVPETDAQINVAGQPLPIARLTPAPLIEDLSIINKVSQNLHAELMLRRVGRASGHGSISSGLAGVRSMLARAGVPRLGYDLSDGSGMSSYNRVAPRAMVTLLRWIAGQPWGAAWRATLPGPGEGTLKRRFIGTPLMGKIVAKTGSLNATTALAGYMTAASGRTLTFAIYANDIPDGAGASKVIDAALLAIAAAH